MEQHIISQPEFGTGHKKLGIYVFGVIACVILTLIAFWVVMEGQLSKTAIFVIIYTAAIIQFLVQVICFLRLNMENEKARMNVYSFLLAIAILSLVIIGSLWIMWNCNYNMLNP